MCPMRNHSGTHFPAFGLNTDRYEESLSHIRTEYGEIRSISPYSVRMRENADQNNSKYRNFLFSDSNILHTYILLKLYQYGVPVTEKQPPEIGPPIQ